ncbi:plasmid mobilization protein [Solidesulfovibrio magneticus]|uniref:plasmid mobilization protein n=1 Tax=Solidesulfovibrio magneticus TaxID=184917 RepID=UPI0005BBE9F4|nr:plasmid mobilization relaxosome protein MobC [Solidesulfovibrio magneticus]
MKENAPNRTAWIKLRVTPAEKEAIMAKAKAQGQTVTDFIRQRALDYRLRKTPLEKEHVRQLARVGALLNQLARWANTYKSRAETIRVLAALLSFERALKRDAAPDDRDRQETSLPLESKPSVETPCI